MEEIINGILKYMGSIFFRRRNEYIKVPFDKMQKLCTDVFEILHDIMLNPIDCEKSVQKNRNRIQPELTLLIENFKGEYYTKNKVRRDYAHSSIMYLKVIDRVFELPQQPYKNVIQNSFLTMIDNREYFVEYIIGEFTFNEKLIELAKYYQKEIDDRWRIVCEYKTVLDNKFIQ